MIDRKTAKWMTWAGVLASFLSGMGSLLIAFLPSFNLAGFGAALLVLGLGVGILLNSRVCAIGALLYFIVMRFGMYPQAVSAQQAQGGNVMLGFWIAVLLFSMFYGMAVVGTFATASLPPVEPSPRGGSFLAGLTAPITGQPQEPGKKKPRVKAESARGICGACSGTGQLPDTKLTCAWCDGKGYM
jgi:hypothetical protein